MRKTNIGGAGKGNFKMPAEMREAEKVPGHGDGNPSYKGHGDTSLNTYKSSQTTKKFAPGSPQTENTAVGHGSKSSYPKRTLPSFGTATGGLQKPPAGMQPRPK